MTLPPWDYLFLSFNDVNFPDLFNPIWIFSVIGIVATVLLYNVRTRQLRRRAVPDGRPGWLAEYAMTARYTRPPERDAARGAGRR